MILIYFVRVFFIASIPGTHSKKMSPNWGLTKLSELLKNNAVISNENAQEWSLCYQCSSIGSLGKNPYLWLLGEVTKTMSTGINCCSFQPSVKVVSIFTIYFYYEK